MSLLKQFSENSEQSANQDVSLTPDNFQQYLEQYGQERALGYRDALRDLLNDLFKPKNGEPVFLTSQRASTMAKNFQQEKRLLLKAADAILDPQPDATSSSTDQKYKPK